MPQVPIQEGQTVAPTATPLPGQSINVSPDVFGASVGAAESGLGRAVEGTGDMLQKHAMQMQADLNEMKVNEAQTKWVVTQGDLWEEYKKNRGLDAVAAREQFIKDLNSKREEIRGSLGNPMAMRLFDQQSMRQLGYTIKDSAGYAASEFRAAQTGAARAARDVAITEAARYAEDDQRFNESVKVAEQRAVDAEDVRGMGPEVEDMARRKARSAAWATRLQQLADDTKGTQSILRARSLFEKNRDNLMPNEQVNLEHQINSRLVSSLSRDYASGISAGGTRAGYEKAVMGTESGGDPTAQAKTSSARGLFQFTDDTWETVRRNHPELGLTPNGRDDPEQQRKAFRVFTEDNAKFLKNSGIKDTGQNLYAAHFLGAEGAVRFIEGATSQPDAPASKFASSAAVEANPAVFNGRTAGEVYNSFRAKMGSAADGLTPFSPTGDLQAWLTEARRMAQTAPVPETLKPELERTTVARVEHEFNNVKKEYNDAQSALRQRLLVAVGGESDPVHAPKSLDELSPEAQRDYALADDTLKAVVRKGIFNNTKADYPLTEEAKQRYNEIRGMMSTAASPADKDAASKLAIIDEELPWTMRKDLLNRQEAMKNKADASSHLNQILGYANVKAALGDAHIAQTSSPSKYRTFVGQLEGQLELIQAETKGKRLNESEAGKLVASMLKSVVVPGTFWNSNIPLYQAPVPPEELAKYKAKFPQATDDEARRAYMHYKLREQAGR